MDRDVNALLAYLAGRARLPHEWGSKANDCVSFVDGAVKAQTGKSALQGLRWSNKTGALRVLAHVGGLETALDARFERIAPAHAHRGDIAGVLPVGCGRMPGAALLALSAEEVELLGVHPFIVAGQTLVSPGPRGLKHVQRDLMTVAWSVTSLKRSGSAAHQPARGTAKKKMRP